MTGRELAKLLADNPDLEVGGGLAAVLLNRSILRMPARSEHELQAAVIDECDLRASQRPEYGLLFAIPNGGWRHPTVAATLKAEGLRAGIPDLFLPVQRHGYGGLFIELKTPTGRLSDEQVAWVRNLTAEGYRCKVCQTNSVTEVVDFIEWYLDGTWNFNTEKRSPTNDQ
jgi:hypothetical protein